MLPILRISPLACFFLVLLILVLALTPPDRFHRANAPTLITAHGPLIDRDEHPEWRQFFIQAAFRRADELNRLHMLPSDPPPSGSLMPAQETVLLNKPLAGLTPAASQDFSQTAPEDNFQALGAASVEPARATLAENSGAISAENPGPANAADAGQMIQANGTVTETKHRPVVRRAKAQRNKTAQPGFFETLFADNSPTPRKAAGKRGRLKTAQPTAPAASATAPTTP